MLAIIDYGMGNLHSVSKALERIGYDYRITSKAQDLRQAQGLILPGVGAFPDAMKELNRLGLVEEIRQLVREGKPLLGICLGMQLLFETSEEGTDQGEPYQGLGLLNGHVRRFPGRTETGEAYKVPHMGWNRLKLLQSHPVLEGITQGYAYFVHSYYADGVKEEELLASVSYHVQVPAIVGRDRLLGMQFHPEKSGPTGMHLLENYCRLTSEVQAS
jgi:glutamine amidotransferase